MSEWERVLSADTSMEARVHSTSEPLPGLVRAFCIKQEQTHSVALEHGGGTSRDWYFIAEQPAPAPHLARPEGHSALTRMC